MQNLSNRTIEKCLCLLLIHLVAMQYQMHAQNTNYQTFGFYDNKDGLSQGTINAIVQDKYGYMWFGTQDGLNKFDGVNFTVYKNEANNNQTISDNYITAIIEDDENNLWIGTRSGGLNKYEVSTGIFTSFKNKKADANSLTHNRVTSLVQTPDRAIWVGTTNGLSRFDPETNQFARFYHNPEDLTSISDNNINNLFVDSGGTLWIGTAHGLNKFDTQVNEFLAYYDEDQTELSSGNDILSLWEDKHRNIWMGSNGEGLKRLNVSSNEISTFVHSGTNMLHNNTILALLGNGEGKIWVATDGGHLKLFDPETSQFTTMKLVFPRVNSLYEDNAKGLWVGMRGGLHKIGKYNTQFRQYSKDNMGRLISPNGDLHALAVDKQGYIWTGSSVDGLKKINRETLEVTSFTHSNSNSLSNNNVRFIHVDEEDVIWIATRDGLNRFDQKANKFKTYIPDYGNPNSICSENINSIYEDSQNRLWICTDKGISIMDKHTEKFTSILHNPERSNSLSNGGVSNVMEDEHGVFWIGFKASGLDMYNPNTGVFKHYSHEDSNVNSLSNDRVSHIYSDRRGNLWIATYGAGLNKFEKSTETFTRYNEKQGLVNTSLYCVIEDKNNNLWMSHNEGISRFDPLNARFSNYFKGTEFNGNAFFQAKDGEILLASYNLVTFVPEEIIDNDMIPPVHINEFKLFDKAVHPGDEFEILEKLTEETDTIVLNYDQNFFSFGFVALNYFGPENNRYRFKLENFDQDWTEVSEYLYANYTNVPPGDYIFRVIGSNNDLVWNEEGDSIFVQIVAPWWGTIPFKVALVLVIVAILILIYKMRVRSIKKQREELLELVLVRTKEITANQEEILSQKEYILKKNEHLEALNEEKNQLINIVSHDLRSPLNQIKGLASIIKMINPDLNKETNNSLDLINDLVDRQGNMISKILDTSAIDANKTNLQMVEVNINGLVEEVVQTMEAVAGMKNIRLELILTKDSPSIEADKSYFIQVIENILSNAIKFSNEGTKVLLTTTILDAKVQVSIKDEGPGINNDDMKHLFVSYTKLSARPTADEDSTGLGLSIAKKYVEAMNGKIWCESEEGEGAKFILEFDTKEM